MTNGIGHHWRRQKLEQLNERDELLKLIWPGIQELRRRLADLSDRLRTVAMYHALMHMAAALQK